MPVTQVDECAEVLFTFAQGPVVRDCVCVGDCVIARNYALSGSLGGLLLNLHLLTNEFPGSQAKGFTAGSAHFCKIPFKTITKTTRLTSNVDLEGFQERVKDESVIHKRHIASDLMQLIRGWHMFPLLCAARVCQPKATQIFDL